MSTANNQLDFLATLQSEAALQSKLHASHLLPAKLDRVTSLIGRYPWQAVTIVSFAAALLTELVKWKVFS
jgi:hypothetical protein